MKMSRIRALSLIGLPAAALTAGGVMLLASQHPATIQLRSANAASGRMPASAPSTPAPASPRDVPTAASATAPAPPRDVPTAEPATPVPAFATPTPVSAAPRPVPTTLH